MSGAYEQHVPEIERALGAPPDLITTVPSTRVVHATQPLQSVLQRVAQLAARCEDALEHTGLVRVQRTVQPDLFGTFGSLKGRRVLLVEDLWVGGTTVESAIHALTRAGASVAVLAAGRQIKTDFRTARQLLETAERPAWW